MRESKLSTKFRFFRNVGNNGSDNSEKQSASPSQSSKHFHRGLTAQNSIKSARNRGGGGDRSNLNMSIRRSVRADDSALTALVERDFSITLIELKFTNVSRSLFLFKVEAFREGMIQAIQRVQRDGGTQISTNVQGERATATNTTYRPGHARVRDELKGFSFDLGSADQKYFSRYY